MVAVGVLSAPFVAEHFQKFLPAYHQLVGYDEVLGGLPMLSAAVVICCVNVVSDRFESVAYRNAAERALPLLQEAAATHVEKKTCFGCHNQGPPLGAIQFAEQLGIRPDQTAREEQRLHIADFIRTNKERFLKGQGTGGGVDTAGTILMALEAVDYPADELTEAVVQYLLKKQADKDHWTCSSNRPPSEASHFTTTYLAVRGLTVWATEVQKPAAQKRLAAAKGWLISAEPKDTEDAVFRLLGLKLLDADRADIEAARQRLLEGQRPDGGWGQLAELPSDAYATATVLFALQEAELARDHQAVRRGLRFLVKNQLEDGSWLIESRSKPFQNYYESGFPHEKNQFISATASGWAAQALLRHLIEKE